MSEKHNNDKQLKKNETLRALAQISHIGIAMAASVLIGVLLGKYLDRLLNTSPWLLLIFSFLGAGAAFKELIDFSKDKK